MGENNVVDLLCVALTFDTNVDLEEITISVWLGF